MFILNADSVVSDVPTLEQSPAAALLTQPSLNHEEFSNSKAFPSDRGIEEGDVSEPPISVTPAAVVDKIEQTSEQTKRNQVQESLSRKPAFLWASPSSHEERRRFRSVVPVRVFLDSPDDFTPEFDSFDTPLKDEEQSYAEMFERATSQHSGT
ncbi:hypothetical protein ACA910_010830 [Epithemia clementina (nom. ined.)]